jgi:hypothetical protein
MASQDKATARPVPVMANRSRNANASRSDLRCGDPRPKILVEIEKEDSPRKVRRLLERQPDPL